MVGNEYIAHKLEGVPWGADEDGDEIGEWVAVGDLMTHLWLESDPWEWSS